MTVSIGVVKVSLYPPLELTFHTDFYEVGVPAIVT
jgi:hypothetical protein